MKINLTSQITLNRVSTKYYKPENAFDRSVLTRFEKIPTDIHESVEEGAKHIAAEIATAIQEKQKKLQEQQQKLHSNLLEEHKLLNQYFENYS